MNNVSGLGSPDLLFGEGSTLKEKKCPECGHDMNYEKRVVPPKADVYICSKYGHHVRIMLFVGIPSSDKGEIK